MAEFVLTVTATGTAGAATGSGNTDLVRGFIEAIVYTYSTGAHAAPGTTTITITEADGAKRTILAVAAGNTNGVAYVRAAAVNTSNAAITNSAVPIYVAGYPLKMAIAGCDDQATVTIRVITRETFVE